MTTYYINTEMLGDATDDDAKIMVAFLQKKGFDVEFTTDCGAINCHPYDDEVEQLKQKIGDVWGEGLQYITTHKSAAALGRMGGSVRSAAKAAAARRNACNVSDKTRQERSERMKARWAEKKAKK